MIAFAPSNSTPAPEPHFKPLLPPQVMPSFTSLMHLAKARQLLDDFIAACELAQALSRLTKHAVHITTHEVVGIAYIAIHAIVMTQPQPTRFTITVASPPDDLSDGDAVRAWMVPAIATLRKYITERFTP